MSGNFLANNCRIVPFRLVGTGINDVYTATGYPMIVGLRVINYHASSTPIVNIMFRPLAEVVNYYLQANYTMPVATSLWFPLEGFAMKEGDTIKVQASIASTIDVLTSIGEVPGRSG